MALIKHRLLVEPKELLLHTTMAALAPQAPASPPDTKPNFMDDDEETLTILLADESIAQSSVSVSSSSGGSISSSSSSFSARLGRLSNRFVEDHHSSDDDAYWIALLNEAHESGFTSLSFDPISISPRQNDRSSSSTGTFSDNPSQLPHSLLETEEGKLHLQATQSLLGLSKDEAAQLTLSTLRNVFSIGKYVNKSTTNSSNNTTTANNDHKEEDKKSLKSLLGSFALLQKVQEYYYKQRAVRISVVAELLRSELDDGSTLTDTIVPVLDLLDRSSKRMSDGKKKNRGLFRLLLTAACRPDVPFTREQLLPAKDGLRGRTPTSLKESMMTRTSGEGAWNQFVSTVSDTKSYYVQRERLEALEALLVLLYGRIEGGVERSDLVLILLAFQSTNMFFTMSTTSTGLLSATGGNANWNERLPRLAALICSECMGFWRVFDPVDSSSNEDSWTSSHPLLLGVVENTSSSAEQEINSIVTLLSQYGNQVAYRRAKKKSPIEAPEGIALLSFGLLLSVAYTSIQESPAGATLDAYWHTFQSVGLELSTRANDKCEAFEYFYQLMDCLVVPPNDDLPLQNNYQQPYELHYFDGKTQSSLVASKDPAGAVADLSAPCILYASIGRELLSVVAMAFGDTALLPSHSSAPENIGMLCNLASVIFRNSPTLCKSFWSDFESYTSSQQNSSVSLPLCSVLDSAHELARSFLQSNPPRTSDDVLRGISPLLQMVAAVVYDSQVVEMALSTNVLPNGLIRSALQLCMQRNIKGGCKDVLSSVCTLAKVAGTSVSGREVLRQSLEDSNRVLHINGPRMLVTIAVNHSDLSLRSLIYTIISELISDAPERWVMEVASSLEWARKVDNRLFEYDDASSTHAIFSLVNALVLRVDNIVFDLQSFDTHSKVAFVSLLEIGLQSCCAVLSNSVSTLSNAKTPYSAVRVVTECLANALMAIRPIIELHEDQQVRVSSVKIQVSIVNSLAMNRGLGEAVYYYATAPASLSLLCLLDEYLVDEDVFLPMSSKDDEEDRKRKFLAEALSSLEIEFDKIKGKGWLYDHDVPFVIPTSLSALRLLNVWARCVDDMVVKEGMDARMLVLSPHRLMSCASVIAPACRLRTDLSSTWTSAGISNCSLMIPYLTATEQQNDLAVPPAIATFDLIFICLTHVKASVDADDSIKFWRECCRSEAFRGAVNLSSIIDLSKVKGMSARELSLSLRSLRVVGLCIEATPSSGIGFLGSDPATSLSKVCGVVTHTIGDVLESQERNSAALFSDKGMVNSMRMAVSCLAIMIPVWRNRSSQDEKVKAVIQGQNNLISQLSSLVFSFTMPPGSDSEMYLHARRLVTSLTSLALELLAVEATWARENSKPVTALDTITEQKISFLISKQSLSTSSSFALYAQSHKDLKVVSLNQSTASSCLHLLHELSETSTQFGRDIFTEINGFDIFESSTSHFLSSFQSNDSSLHDLDTSFRKLAVSQGLLRAELYQNSAWKKFADSFSLLLSKWRTTQSSSSHPLLSTSSGSLALNMANEVCMALYKNMESVEQTQLDCSRGIFENESLQVAQSATSLLLHFTAVNDDGSWSFEPVEWSQTIGLVNECSKKLVSVLGVRAATDCPLQQLIACAAKILSVQPETSSMPHDIKSRCEDVQIDLASTACEVLSAVEFLTSSEGHSHDNAMYCSCISLLTSLMANVGPQPSYFSQHTYGAKLHQSFQNGAINSLVHQVCMNKLDLDLRIIKSVLTLFTAMAAIGSSFLSQLVDNGAATLLETCAVIVDAPANGDVPHGYSTQKSPGGAFPLVDDPAHQVWRMALKFLSTSLQSSFSSTAVRDSTRTRLITMALHFFTAHSDKLLVCLQQCCLRPGGSTPSLTLNALREVACVLSVASELCSRDSQDSFKSECPEIFDTILHYSKSLLVSLSSYLGAAGASRDLFLAMDEFEKAQTMPVEQYQLAAVSPAYHLLASSGEQNAQHEAIRYSHLVDNSSTSITEKERKAQVQFSSRWKSGAQKQKSDPQSLTLLQNKCRSIVTSDFEFEIEKVASEALYLAIQILWRTHPASSAFVCFSAEEARELDAMPLVTRGMVIAFREHNQSNYIPWLTVAGEPRDSLVHANVMFGKVLHSDTVNRQWQVSIIGGGPEDGALRLVPKNDLAGIEDVSKRRCVLSYFPAPETSSHLKDAALGAASSGNLILALRWCKQFACEMQSWDAPLRNGFTGSTIERLAELASALLATELSLNRETGSGQEAERQGLNEVFAYQVFDLFGDGQEAVESISADPDGSVEGRLKGILSPSTMTAVRGQLRPELQQARSNFQEEERRKKAPIERDPRFGFRRSGSGSLGSPFRLGL